MEPRLLAIWDRVARAQQHFQEVERLLVAHYNSDVGELSGEFDSDADGYFTLRGRGFGLPHPRIHTITGELLHDLRSALEHLAWVLVEANGGQPSEHTCFPVLKARPTANKKGIHPAPHVAGGVSAAGAALIDATQPYQWDARFAEHPVWVLDKLWNIDKHRHVVLRGVRMDGFHIPAGTPRFTFTMRVGSVSVDGAELVLVSDDPTVNVDIRTTSQVFVHEPQDGVSTPLRRTLEDVRFAVFQIIKDAEDHCF